MGKITVPLGDRSYDILIGPGLIDQAGGELSQRFSSRQIRIISDETVAELYLSRLTQSLETSGFSVGSPVLVSPGEASKSFSTFEHLTETLLASKIERSTILVALGGGVIGDLTGFAASVLLRGLKFVQIPTSLLSQVDSSVGGKTGINTKSGKNLIGTFHQPSLVLADTDTLGTLSRRELLSGYAEVIKYGLIVDPGFFDFLETSAQTLIDGDTNMKIHAIKRSCEIKAEIVARDEHEHGDRALLNFGHTFGHALEAATGYGARLTHGEAVAIGSIMAMDLSVRLQLCPIQDLTRVLDHYRALGLPVTIDKSWKLSKDDLIQLIKNDKKKSDGKTRFVLTRGIGKAFTGSTVEDALVSAVLSDHLK